MQGVYPPILLEVPCALAGREEQGSPSSGLEGARGRATSPALSEAARLAPRAQAAPDRESVGATRDTGPTCGGRPPQPRPGVLPPPGSPWTEPRSQRGSSPWECAAGRSGPAAESPRPEPPPAEPARPAPPGPGSLGPEAPQAAPRSGRPLALPRGPRRCRPRPRPAS